MRAARVFPAFLLPAFLLLTLPALAATAPSAAHPPTYKKDLGPFLVVADLLNWQDTARNRPVPVKIYSPATGKGPFPVIVFSHGLGGAREGYEYLGRQWASQGYVAVHVEHLGSDATVLKKGGRILKEMREAAEDPGNALARPLDVRFVLNQLEQVNRGSSPLAHRLDLDHIGMAGHSFGAWTTLAVAGQAVGQGQGLADPRIKAAISMSAPAPRRRQNLDRVYSQIRIPVLHMTGTRDDSPLGETSAAERRLPFDHIHGADQYLVTFEGGDHMVFSGRRLQGEAGAERAEQDARFHSLILQGTTAFWDAYLKGNAEAKAWLVQGGYAAVLGKDGKLEEKVR
jgi:predicted dienelactone hydrolase